jgi:hypothetical protein
MATLRYALEENGPRRLELSWEGQYQNFTVKLDNQPVGRVADHKALAAGQRLALPDGSTLEVRTVGTALANELRVLRDGRPLPGSASDPRLRLRNSYQLLFLIAGVNLAAGFLAGVLRVTFLVELGFSGGSFVLGVVYLVLGLLVRQRSAVGLALALSLYGLEAAMGLVVPLFTGGSPNLVALAVRLLFLWVLGLAFPALRQLRQAEPAAPTTKAAQP